MSEQTVAEEKKMTKVEAVTSAINSGVKAVADIERYCDGLGVKVSRAYISSIKWHLMGGAKKTASTPGAECKPDVKVTDLDLEVLRFAIQSGGLKQALAHLEWLKNVPGFKLAEKLHGLSKVKKALTGLGKRLTA